jgi:hypothetical protein
MDRSEQRRLDQLIEEVSRGQRELASIRDAKLREGVRIALRLHADRPSPLDGYARMRMRARVLSGLEARSTSLGDRVTAVFELLARPAPYIVRAVAILAIALSVCLGVAVASMDANPDDLLYPLKLASEDGRLSLAIAPADRAAVELSIAEHRLAEAERFAADGRTSDALVASAVYTQHIASAAAELGPEAEGATLGAQLETTFIAQRERANTLAATLSAKTKSAQSSQVLAMIAAPSSALGRTQVERVAETAAALATDIADVAAVAAGGASAAPAPASSRAVVVTSAADKPTARVLPSLSAPAPGAAAAATATRKAATEARAAADKLQNAINGMTKPTVGRAP